MLFKCYSSAIQMLFKCFSNYTEILLEFLKVLERLRVYVAWVAAHSGWDATTKLYYFTDGVLFHDQSFLYSAAFRKESWVKKGDRQCDMNDRGGGRRIILLDCLHTGKFVTSTRLAWDSTHEDGTPFTGR